MDNGPQFNGKSCADPLEPEYNGGSRSTAKFYWNNGKPIVRSHAHGVIKYMFRRFSAKEPVDFEAADDDTLRQDMDWKTPLPVKDELPPVEPMRAEMMPEPFRAWVAEAADRMQVPADFLIVPLVAVCASVIGTSCCIRPKQQDDWSVVPNLWGGIVGPPSMMKTPALNEAVNKTLGRLEAAAGKAYQEALAEYEVKVMIADAEQSKLKEEIKKTVKAGQDTGRSTAELAGELRRNRPERPAERRYKTNDSSIEKIVELLRDNPRGLLYFRDELIALFKRMERAGNEQDRAFMLEAWNGDGCHVDDRIGRGTVRADNICLSLLGGIQPDKIAEYLHRAVASGDNDGFVQRLQLMVYPDPAKDWQYIDRKPDSAARNRACKVIQALAELEVMPSENQQEKPFLRFSRDGQAVFQEWLTRLQREKLTDERDHSIILEHLAKYRSLMPSLALVFHLIECADQGRSPDPVSREAAEKAAAWCQYLESHARRIYSLALNTGRLGGEALAKKIRSGALPDGFKLRDVQMKKWGLLTSGEAVQDALDWLVEKHWLREMEPDRGTAQGGRPPASSYAINPKIFAESGKV